MSRRMLTSFTLAFSALCVSSVAEDASCHPASHFDEQARLTNKIDEQALLQLTSRIDEQAEEALLADCPLPANSQWCTVSVGTAKFPMAVYNSAEDIVSRSICTTGTWEISTQDIMAIGKPGHALDIGANVGFYSFVLAASGWNVSAFEPMSSNQALIEASMCMNPTLASKITLNKVGLGAKDDQCIIISGVDNVGDGLSKCGADALKPVPSGYVKRASIDIRRLDDILAQQQVTSVDFVKMDVEGFECQVMAGGQSLLKTFRPRLIQSEVWHSMQGCLPQDYLASFANASYKVAKDRTCTSEDLTRPDDIVNRYMCRKSTVSLMQISGSPTPDHKERFIVWFEAA